MARLTCVFAIVLLAALPACELSTEPDPLPAPRELSAHEQEALSSSQRFGFTLFQALHEEEPEENLFISPLSASMALGMTLNGAEGETYEAMQEALALSGLSEAEINEAYGALIEFLTTLDPEVTTGLANSIWYREDFAVEDAFVETNREYFGAEIEALDFSSEEAPGIINAWVEEHTEGRIEEIVEPPIPAHVVMYLINAVYFEGDWTYPFDPEETRPAPFTLADGTEVTVDMMRQQELEIPFYRGEDFVAADLPYGHERYSMTVIVPEGEASAGDLAARLDADLWDAIIDNLAVPERGVTVELPKFELEWESSLNDVLAAMGMAVAFTGEADFSRMTPGGGIQIEEVKQKTFLKIDEEGTEAAAATKVVMVESVPPTLRADRPFLLVIRERSADTLLFMGRIMDPTA